jgi:hypothetical protein
MNKLTFGFLYLIAGSLSFDASPAPELIERARGYATKHIYFSTIHAENGIDRTEAFTIAEPQILGEIDLKQLPVQSYDRPKKDGDFWRIDVRVKTPQGLKNQPIFVHSITGDSHGDGWYNEGSFPVDLGRSSYRIDRNANGFSVEVSLKKFTVANNFTARKQCYRDAVRAIEKIARGFPGRFERVPIAAIVMYEGKWADTHDEFDRQWTAKFPLIQKRSIKTLKH